LTANGVWIKPEEVINRENREYGAYLGIEQSTKKQQQEARPLIIFSKVLR
jgi:hypothetical protein